MIKICVSGSKGKMGSKVAALAKDDPELEVSGEFDVDVDPKPLIAACECLVEFTTPEATLKHLAICKREKKAMVIGTTGLSDADAAKIKEASDTIPIVFSPNMSIGVNLLFKMVQDAAKVLGPEYNVEIIEAHHINKKDKPSGTAKELERIVRDVKRDIKIPIESVREDEIVGEHTITFDSPLDVVEITHSAKTRDIFAKGALAAAKFVVTKSRGLFAMTDVLAL